MKIVRAGAMLALTALAACSPAAPPTVSDQLASATSQQEAVAAVTAWSDAVKAANAQNWPAGYAVACAADAKLTQYEFVCPIPGSDPDSATGVVTATKAASGYSYGLYLKAGKKILDEGENPFTWITQYSDDSSIGFGSESGNAVAFAYEYVKVLGEQPDGLFVTKCIRNGTATIAYAKLAASCQLKNDTELTITVAKQ